MAQRIPISLTETQALTDEAQPAPVRHPFCPSVSLHLLCINLLSCRKKHNSFVVYSSQSGSELGVVSCFLCSPDSMDSDSVAQACFSEIYVFLQETKQTHQHKIISPPSVFYKYVVDFQVWVISQTAASCQRTRLWWKQCDARVTLIFQRSSAGLKPKWSMTAEK